MVRSRPLSFGGSFARYTADTIPHPAAAKSAQARLGTGRIATARQEPPKTPYQLPSVAQSRSSRIAGGVFLNRHVAKAANNPSWCDYASDAIPKHEHLQGHEQV